MGTELEVGGRELQSGILVITKRVVRIFATEFILIGQKNLLGVQKRFGTACVKIVYANFKLYLEIRNEVN